MTELTPRFALPLLQPGQAQKELFHNEALARIDAALHPVVTGVGVTTPPASPGEGAMWIVGAAATGDWSGQDDSLAIATSGGWRFVVPVAGMLAWDASAGHWALWDGAGWRSDLPAATITVGGIQVVGAQQPAIADPAGGAVIDAEVRATVASILTALRQHGLIA